MPQAHHPSSGQIQLGDIGLKVTPSLAMPSQPNFLPSSLSTGRGVICLGTWATPAGLQPPLPQTFSRGLWGPSALSSHCGPSSLLRDFVLLRSTGCGGSVSISGPQNPLLSCIFSVCVSLDQAPGFPHPGPTPGPRQEPCVGAGMRPSDISSSRCLETVLHEDLVLSLPHEVLQND